MSEVTIELTINQEKRTATVPSRTTLADLLRDHFELTGTHLGCEQGVCGACTVFVDELPVRSCLTLAASCQDSEVLTIEGFTDANPDVRRLRKAFSRESALQCGFCTPGMLITGYDLVRRRETFTREEVALALSGNICRCTGYNGIVSAVQSATAEGIQAEE